MSDDEEVATATVENRYDEAPGIGSAPDSVDEASDESFPASDPPSKTPITGIGCPCHSEGGGQQQKHWDGDTTNAQREGDGLHGELESERLAE